MRHLVRGCSVALVTIITTIPQVYAGGQIFEVEPANNEITGEEVCQVDFSYRPQINPQSFVAKVDNPHFPLIPGTAKTFGSEGTKIVFEVTFDTRIVMGVTTTVVRETEWEDGELVEDTFDWYAQDVLGNVWYFGEDTREIEKGKIVSTEGSWEAGIDGAQPGIIMLANPQVGDVYRQEYFACEAEDMGEVIGIDETVTIALGTFNHCVRIRDFTPLEPKANEHKIYCADIGLIQEIDLVGGDAIALTIFEEIAK